MKVSNIWVFSDYSEHFKDIMGGAKEIGEKVVCFALNKDDAKKLSLLVLMRFYGQKKANW